MSITVGVTTFNGRALLERTLPSIVQDQTERELHIVVVDDGSTDGTDTWLAERYPNVEVVRHDSNRGVAAAMNTALAAGMSSDYVALLNNDVELAPWCLERLCAALDNRPGYAAVSPKMLRFADRNVLDGAGDVYSWIGWAKRRGQGLPDDGRYAVPEPVFGVCGGAAVYRSSAVREVGFFDEEFFAYYEDVDWAVRANRMGFRCFYDPAAVAFHMDGATTGGELSPFTGYHSWRNAVWVVAKNWSAGDIARFGWLFVIGQLLTATLAIERGMFRTLLAAWRDALLGARRMRQKDPYGGHAANSLRLPLIPPGTSDRLSKLDIRRRSQP